MRAMLAELAICFMQIDEASRLTNDAQSPVPMHTGRVGRGAARGQSDGCSVVIEPPMQRMVHDRKAVDELPDQRRAIPGRSACRCRFPPLEAPPYWLPEVTRLGPQHCAASRLCSATAGVRRGCRHDQEVLLTRPSIDASARAIGGARSRLRGRHGDVVRG